MNHWIYSPTGKAVLQLEDLPNHNEIVGFVYKITNLKTDKLHW